MDVSKMIAFTVSPKDDGAVQLSYCGDDGFHTCLVTAATLEHTFLPFLDAVADTVKCGGCLVAHDAAGDTARLTELWFLGRGECPEEWMLAPVLSTSDQWAGRVRVEERTTPAGLVEYDRLLVPKTTPPSLRELIKHRLGEDPESLLAQPESLLRFIRLAAGEGGEGGQTTVLLPLPEAERAGAANALKMKTASLVAAADKQYACDHESRAKLRRCEQGTDVWHQARRPITASTVGTILGLNAFRTPFEELLAKISPQRLSSCAMNFGTFFEDMAQHMYIRWATEEFHDVNVTNMGTEIIEEPFEYCSLSPDGLVELRRTAGGPSELGVLEYKCPGRGQFLDADGETLKISLLEKPEYYAQVQFEMHMFKKLGQNRNFTHFVFLSYDIPPRPMIRAAQLFASPTALREHLTGSLFPDDDLPPSATQIATLYRYGFVATKLPGEQGWFLPFHHEIGAVYPCAPAVFLADDKGTCCVGIADIYDFAMPKNMQRRDLGDDRGVLGFVCGVVGAPDAMRAKLRKIPDTPPDDLQIRPFISDKRRSPYLREFLRCNGVQCVGDKKVQLLRKSKALRLEECTLPGVRNQVCASIVEYAYDPEFCKRMESRFRPWFEEFVCARG